MLELHPEKQVLPEKVVKNKVSRSTYFEDSDFNGGDLESTFAVDKEDCCRQCFTYSGRGHCLVMAYGANTCYLKSGSPGGDGKPTGRKAGDTTAGICVEEEPEAAEEPEGPRAYPTLLCTDFMDFDGYLTSSKSASKGLTGSKSAAKSAAASPCSGCLGKAPSCSAACSLADPKFTSGRCSSPASTDPGVCCTCTRGGDPKAMSVADDDAFGHGGGGDALKQITDQIALLESNLNIPKSADEEEEDMASTSGDLESRLKNMMAGVHINK